ncbi:cadherin-like domain-containing protein [Bathymodiolus japonicus methanotrophic gill symbiont]|uniref:cadherin-like domain-containing protein n=1 Tax=Bathymodiolus japonicus methanotrophic gill symbiont TaxID=113269 RepID=UPI001C8E1D6B|nr:cadherin-like domain-containing protein [Bathymodiolus japonicus methanotrophic gill symbiont]
MVHLPINLIPVIAAPGDAYSVVQDGILTIPAPGLLANDLDIDGDKLFVLIQTFPANGALHQDLDGGFTYQPAPGFQGVDSYSYMASDSHLNSKIVTVTLHVNHTNHPPLAGADSYSTARNTVLQISATQGVLANDIDLDADQLTALIVSQPTNGSVQLNKDGSFKYTPVTDYAGLDSFSYNISVPLSIEAAKLTSPQESS